MIVSVSDDDGRQLLARLVAYLQTIDDVWQLGNTNVLSALVDAGAGIAAAVVLDLSADQGELADTVRQLNTTGKNIVIISIIGYPESPVDGTLLPLDRAGRPHLAPQELAVLLAYTSGMTLAAAARHIGVRPTTAKLYLERVKEKYRRAGRPTYTKLDLAARVREDGLTPHG